MFHLLHFIIIGHHLSQRHAEDSIGNAFNFKPNVVLEEKLPIHQTKPNQRRFPPLYDPVPMADRLSKVQVLDQNLIAKSRINKPKPPDEQKAPGNLLRPFPRLANISDNGIAKRDRNENEIDNDDAKSESSKSSKEMFPLSGLTQRQIPSQIGQPETYSECDLTLHEPDCQAVLDICFPSNGNPTLGLPRSVAPHDSQLDRYTSLVDNSIPDHMVAPISKMMVDGTHRNVPKQLMERFKSFLKDLDDVSDPCVPL